jgi:SNF2 family DNA or RNA helicase
MGFGKTLQALVGMAITSDNLADGDKTEHTSLIVCPSTVVGHWVARSISFSPDGPSSARFITQGASERKSIWSNTMPRCNIVVTSYCLRSDMGSC